MYEAFNYNTSTLIHVNEQEFGHICLSHGFATCKFYFCCILLQSCLNQWL